MQIIGFMYKENKCVKDINVTKQDIEKAIVKSSLIGMAVYNGLDAGAAHAGSVTESLQPLVDVLKDLAEPVSYGFMIKGFMKIMAGEEHEGMKVIKGAIGGYVGIQWIPYIFNIIKSIKF